MENENRDEGVTIGEVFRIIFKRIWYILGASVVFTVAVVLILAFVINPLRATYSMDFTLVFPLQEDNIYPDGSPFFYQEIVSEEFLTKAKESDPALSNINVAKMSRLGEISITPESIIENNTTVYTGRYTVEVHGSYFTNQDQAEKFIRALAEVPVSLMKKAATEVNYSFDKNNFDNAPFRERLVLLAEEKETLLSNYDRHIKTYSETYSVQVTDADGKPVIRRLKDFRDSVIALYGESVQTELENMLEEGGYDYYYLYPETYEEILREEYNRNETEIEAFRNSFGTLSRAKSALLAADAKMESGGTVTIESDPLQRLADLITRNNRIDHWIGISEGVTGTLTKENVDKFAARLEKEYETLDRSSQWLTEVVTAVYAREMAARFDAQRIVSSGSIGTVVGAIGAFIGGLLIASVVTYAVESNGKRKKEEGSEGSKKEA